MPYLERRHSSARRTTSWTGTLNRFLRRRGSIDLRLPACDVGKFGRNRPGAKRGDGNIGVSEFGPKSFTEASHVSLCRRVDREMGNWYKACRPN